MTPEEILQLLRNIGLDYDYFCDAGAHVGQVRLKLTTPYATVEVWEKLRGELRKLESQDTTTR